MALFDYNRVMSSATKEKTAEKSELTKKSELTTEAVVSEQADVEASMGEPVVFRQVPMGAIKPSLIDGYLKFDVKDSLSENGKGTLYVPSDCVKQSYDNNRTVLPGMQDIEVPPSLQDRLVYTMTSGGKLDRVSIDMDRLKGLIEAQSVLLKGVKQAGMISRDIQQMNEFADDYGHKDV